CGPIVGTASSAPRCTLRRPRCGNSRFASPQCVGCGWTTRGHSPTASSTTCRPGFPRRPCGCLRCLRRQREVGRVSLRTLTRGRLGLEDLCEAGMMPVEVRDKLRRLVLARKNLLVTGGTGTGKTTLLAALLGEVPEHERIVVVEDTPELMPTHPHVVALAAREGNADGAGEIGMRLLLRQCLRMRPDRIVVGEVRGAEVADLLVALNTGHAGSAGTMHA